MEGETMEDRVKRCLDIGYGGDRSCPKRAPRLLKARSMGCWPNQMAENAIRFEMLGMPPPPDCGGGVREESPSSCLEILCEPQKVSKQSLALVGQYRFGMKLDAVGRLIAMCKGHDLALVRTRRYHQMRRV